VNPPTLFARRRHCDRDLGVDQTRRSAVRWGVAGNIVTAWVLTLPSARLIAALSYWILHVIVRV
jgi:PiT family inorganic phosphate transporter